MNSIQNKILTITISAILICALALGHIGYNSVQQVSHKNSERVMRSIVTENAAKYDRIFSDTMNITNILAGYTQDRIASLEDLQQPGFVEKFNSRAELNFVNVANNSDYAASIYVRFNPKFTYGTAGMFFVRNAVKFDNPDKRTMTWLNVPPTDINKYANAHYEFMSWWDEALQNGKPIWVAPHQDNVIDGQVLSYVVPIYLDGEIAAVVGCDIRYDLLTAPLKDIHVFETGSGFLLDKNGQIIYHPKILDPKVNARVKNDRTFIAQKVKSITETNNTFTFKNTEGSDMMISLHKLGNDMYLAAGANIEEINVERNEMLTRMLISTIIIVMMLAFITIVFTHRLVAPLKKLTFASEQIASGDLDNVKLPETQTNDEIGRLNDSLKRTVSSLRKYINRVNGLAYQDPITGVKNRTAFLEAASKMDLDISSSKAEFAIVVFDINNLKQVNDSLGHEYGDKLIVLASKVICPIFKHSPIFRIGGDEFTAILTGTDYENRQQLMHKFTETINGNIDTGINFKLIIASGIADYNEATDIFFDDVLIRADKAMYENKRKLKKEET